MAKSKQVVQAPASDTEPDSELESEPETIEVQVASARKRAKGVPAHKETGKAVQAKGAAAKKASGAASVREREVARLAKKNDHLERLKKIDELEQAERERAALLAEKQKSTKKASALEAGDLDSRFAKLEAMLMARNDEPKHPKPKAKKKPPPPPSSSEEDEPPRQKAVRKSAKAELRKKAGAREEELNNRGHLVGNKSKKAVMQHDHERAFLDLASQLLPGRF